MENSININKELVSKAQEAMELLSNISEEVKSSLSATIYTSDYADSHISIYGDHSTQNGQSGFTVFKIYTDGHIDIRFIYDDTEVSEGATHL